jgi:hypothetical protein
VPTRFDGPPASTLQARYWDLFTAGAEFGFPFPGGTVMDFSGPDAMSTFLPQSGAPAGLDHSLSDPTSTSAGVFGGQVVALGLNVGFSDLGVLSHPLGVSFGDLILTGYTGTVAGLNGRTVRQLNQIVNAALGGGFEPFSIVDLSQVVGETNSSFEGGYISAYAETHYELPTVTAPVPEPSTWALTFLPMLGIGLFAQRRRAPSSRRQPMQILPTSTETASCMPSRRITT